MRRSVLPFLPALLPVFVSVLGGADEKLVGGPYVVNVGPRTATVMWLLETSRASIGLDPAKLDKDAPALRSEKITFTGLQPGKTYHYNINGKERSEEHT